MISALGNHIIPSEDVTQTLSFSEIWACGESLISYCLFRAECEAAWLGWAGIAPTLPKGSVPHGQRVALCQGTPWCGHGIFYTYMVTNLSSERLKYLSTEWKQWPICGLYLAATFFPYANQTTHREKEFLVQFFTGKKTQILLAWVRKNEIFKFHKRKKNWHWFSQNFF